MNQTPRASRWKWALLACAVAALVALVITTTVLLINLSGSEPGEVPIDQSDSPSGTRGLILLLEEHGAEVARSAPPFLDEPDVALLHSDVPLDRQELREVATWIEDGGVFVVLGAPAPWATISRSLPPGEVSRGPCDLSVLDDVSVLELGPQGGTALTVEVASAGSADHGDQAREACFRPPGAAPERSPNAGLVTMTSVGSGAIVGVGSQEIFTNRWLANADNSVLATSLLAPEPGTRVAVVESAGGLPRDGTGQSGPGIGGDRNDDPPSRPGQDTPEPEPEDQTLLDLLPTGLRWALLQLVLAAVVLALWKARRFGQPVPEPSPVPIAGAGLVEAVGELMRRAGSPERATEILQEDLRSELATRLGLTREAAVELIADRTATGSGNPELGERVRKVLTAGPADSGAELVELARKIEEVREEVLHGVRA